MIVDGHCHAWRRWPYQPFDAKLEADCRIEGLLGEMNLHQVDAALVICARIGDNDDNVDYVVDAASCDQGRLYAFPDVDCSWHDTYHRRGSARQVRSAAERWGAVGVTHYLGADNDGWLVSAEGAAFFEAAAELNLIVSLAAPAAWQRDLRVVAERFPTVPILCHHLGLVSAADGLNRAELDQVLESASCSNIFVKVSGPYHASRSAFDVHDQHVVSLVAALHEAFGAERMCWGSDYPVCRLFGTYLDSLNFLRNDCAFLSNSDRDAILGSTLMQLLETRSPRHVHQLPSAASSPNTTSDAR